ncbi:hypothetical protein ACOAOT_08670 [Lacrimispora sp. AGF001]|uniref:hypothetical protein n=1 Tax=Lacrimispora sp. AGF001 TaxID=3401631 RepID=UPI003B4362A4
METRLMKKQMTAAYQYSYVRLVLNYYTLLETVAEEAPQTQQMADYLKRLNSLIGECISGKEVNEDLLSLRKDMTHEVEILTSYADCFQIFEYILNRMERKFISSGKTNDGDEAFLKRLMGFITDTSDSAVMNGRIKQIMGQLPVRLTKQKFYSLLMEGLSVYLGSPRENLRDMMYTLRTESMVSLPEGMEAGHKEIYEILQQFKRMDYRDMTFDSFEEASAKLSYASQVLTDESGFYVMLQDVINDLCVLMFAKQDAVIDVSEEEFYRSVISGIQVKLDQEDFTLGEDEFLSQLTQLEGRQEAYYERYLKVEVLNEESADDGDYIRSMNVDRLLSGSSFAELIIEEGRETISGEESAIVDKSYLDQQAEAYIQELEELFADAPKPVVRAVMAKVLSDLPVYFNSIDEIQEYVRGSLSSCLDRAEKETCMELLEELMDYENKLV